ncbi:hypothetical protein TcWFU_006705 [Taenia crassiceps]|uniref:Uncharacterized protein n=1 Tax=Taenia crassiceps TaxID=6207 RepID=A0ABR4Q9M6_9CEST
MQRGAPVRKQHTPPLGVVTSFVAGMTRQSDESHISSTDTTQDEKALPSVSSVPWVIFTFSSPPAVSFSSVQLDLFCRAVFGAALSPTSSQ